MSITNKEDLRDTGLMRGRERGRIMSCVLDILSLRYPLRKRRATPDIWELAWSYPAGPGGVFLVVLGWRALTPCRHPSGNIEKTIE